MPRFGELGRTPGFARLGSIVLFTIALPAGWSAEGGRIDPAFAKVPFEKWFTDHSQTPLKWKARISPAQLSVHQRLWTHLEIQLDGAEVANRLGKGEFVFFVQFSDSNDQLYQNHFAIDLAKMDEGIRHQDLLCSMFVFVLPGDYRVAIAVYNSATGEHSVKDEKLRVAPLKNDPLPDMWSGVPPIEFVDDIEPPDSWFLPSQKGRLHLVLQPRHPVQIDVLVNVTPSEHVSGSARAQNRNLAVLIPALKVISQIELANASRDIELLDLTRQRVTFRQNSGQDLDWRSVKESLKQADAGVIDVKSLGARRDSAGFFIREVAGKIGVDETEQPRAVIILSGPVVFESGENLQPISRKAPAGTRIYYIRYRTAARLRLTPENGRVRGMGRMRPPRPDIPQSAGAEQTDELEPTLKPAGPRLFDVETPEQFRKAIAAILAEVSTL